MLWQILLSTLWISVAHCFVQGFVDTGNLQFSVRLRVFSGRRDPSWVISRAHPLYSRLAMDLNRVPPTRLPSKLGYKGFSIEVQNAFGQRAVKTIGAMAQPALERILLDSSSDPIEPQVRQHVVERMRGRRMYGKTKIYRTKLPFKKPFKIWKFCKHPRFDPENWNIVPVPQWENNCYNYATQQRTDTFAQPGRACGSMYPVPIDAPGVLEACLCDRLLWLPFFPFVWPKIYPGLCTIALVIAPGWDFHFYRLDNNLMWSHKPGGTEVVNTDNKGDPIWDPRFADRGPYTVFVGYLGNHHGVTVN